MKKKYLVILSMLLLPNMSGAEEARLRTVTVTGQAEQEFAPDIAKFSVNIIGKSTNRGDAKSAHDDMLKTLMKIATKYKIEEKDLSTGFSSVNPNYEYIGGKRKFVNYTAQTQINITLRELDKVAILQDAFIEEGFDSFQGPNYTLNKMFTYNDKVLANAVDNAKQKAISIAARMGEEIGKPIEIREDGASSVFPQPVRYSGAMMASRMSEESAPQPSGVINIKSTVVATFSLK